MAALGEAAFLHVGDVFAEGGEAFLLETAVFGGEITVGNLWELMFDLIERA